MVFSRDELQYLYILYVIPNIEIIFFFCTIGLKKLAVDGVAALFLGRPDWISRSSARQRRVREPLWTSPSFGAASLGAVPRQNWFPSGCFMGHFTGNH